MMPAGCGPVESAGLCGGESNPHGAHGSKQSLRKRCAVLRTKSGRSFNGILGEGCGGRSAAGAGADLADAGGGAACSGRVRLREQDRQVDR